MCSDLLVTLLFSPLERFYLECAVFLCVTTPPAEGPTLLRQMNMGSLTCAYIWVRVVHTKWGQALTSLNKS